MLTNGRTTDAGVTGILIAHLGAFGSGELIIAKLFPLSIYLNIRNNERGSEKQGISVNEIKGYPIIVCQGFR